MNWLLHAVIATFSLLLLLPSMTGQTIKQTEPLWTTKARLNAEEEVAKKINSMRASEHLPELRRVRASMVQVQLVCTAAITRKEVRDPRWGGLETYDTQDLSAETESLRIVAFGTSQSPDGGPRYRVYSDKDWPRYSVSVLLNPKSSKEKPNYTVGVARRMSSLGEFLAPASYDNPIKDSNDWKEQVVPACRAMKP